MHRRNNDDGQTNHRNNRVLRLFRRFMTVTEECQDDHFVVQNRGKLYAMPLLAALDIIEFSDLLFATDSVPAALSLTQTTFVAYSSIALAVLGLRAFYFALEGLIHRFVYLHYGLAAILIFVGAKFVTQGFGLQVPLLASLVLMAAILAILIVASVIATRGSPGAKSGGSGT